MKNWWRTDEELMKNWWRADKEVMKNWWRTDEELMKNWWRTDEELTKSWWSTDEELMKSCWSVKRSEMCRMWFISYHTCHYSCMLINSDNFDFTDVTLACEDGQQIEAHRVILSASSPFFQSLLKRNEHSHPIIFMRGMNSKNLDAMWSSTFIRFHPLSYDFIQFDSLSSTYIHFHPFSSTFIPPHPL